MHVNRLKKKKKKAKFSQLLMKLLKNYSQKHRKT